MAAPGIHVWYTDMRLSTWLLIFVSGLQLGGFCTIPRVVLSTTIGIWIVGLLTLAAMVGHCVPAVFNRMLPKGGIAWLLTSPGGWNTLARFAWLLNPLEIVWRFATAPWRTLPDLYILGEVRCGTTTTAAYLERAQGVRGPFCPWIHPLGDKESFYFVGHYRGFVHPYFYRMCFPLQVTKWFNRRILCRRFVCYDGCAQYLTAPWVPRLISAVTPNARFIVCVRDPVLQNLSWWRFEQAAMAWGTSLHIPGPCGRCPAPGVSSPYPPADFSTAVRRSQEEMDEVYARAAALTGPWLPCWAITWPDGQLSSFAKNGCFLDNILRYATFFKQECICVLEVGDLKMGCQVVMRRVSAELGLDLRFPQDDVTSGVPIVLQKNRSTALREDLEPDLGCLRELASFYFEHNLRLYEFLERDLGWHDAEHYAHKRKLE